MEVDRTHRNPSSNTTLSRELFICFTSRLSSSSSSMKKISKSILSPSRSRDPPISLSTSLSRRLRTNGSIKGGQASPMFPTAGGKKNRCAFENPEPSSPKVTCIGQVRVKSKKKKQAKNLRSLSRRHSSGEVSFRRLEQARDGFSQNQNIGRSYQQQPSNVSIQESMPQRNQRWVHLPLTICEALRTIGSDFSCLFPCKSSCFSTSEREKEERRVAAAARSGEGNEGQSSCAAVFRWLVAVQDGEGGGKGGRDIELVVGGIDDDREERRREFLEREGRKSRRRHVFDDLEIVDNRIQSKDEDGGVQEGRVSICIPPKNALLLMRCRSDPVQMEVLTSKFCESPAPVKDVIDEEEEVAERVDDDNEFKDCEVEEKEENVLILDEEQEDLGGEEYNLEIEKENQEAMVEFEDVEEEKEVLQEETEDVNMYLDCLFEEFADEQVIENVQDPIQEEEEEAHAETTMEDNGAEETMVEELAEFEAKEESIEEDEETQDQNFEDVNELLTCETQNLQEETVEDESNERESVSQMEDELVRESELPVKLPEKVNTVAAAALPDCLLLMMCEPKLSMEVSKETWVCSTDFIRRQQPQKKIPATVKPPIDGGDEESTTKKTVVNSENNLPPAVMAYRERNPVLYQPPRSSCCLPAPATTASMATMIEEKLVNAMGCEPFVLTRCKSEPMRNASKRVPETCFWKNRKVEPLRRAAGLGF